MTDSAIHGGAEHALRNHVRLLDPTFEVVVFGWHAEVVEWIAEVRPGARTVLVPPIRNKADVRGILASLRALHRLRPALVHANLTAIRSCRYWLLGSILLPRLTPIAVEQLPTPPLSGWQRRWKRALARRLAAHVAVGAASARTIERDLRLPEGCVRVVHNGVPDVELPAVGRTTDGILLGSHARLDEQKGFDVLLRAVAPLDVSLVLVGDGPERAALEALAEELGMADRLTITGWSEDARRWLPTFDVYVLPSRNEGFPLALLEAMLARRPIVATDVGSVAEAVTPDVGVLVPPLDVQALRSAIQSLAEDASARAAMGEAARARALREFTDQAMTTRYEQLYEGLLVGG